MRLYLCLPGMYFPGIRHKLSSAVYIYKDFKVVDIYQIAGFKLNDFFVMDAAKIAVVQSQAQKN
jgi:hypothetical protein